MITERSQLDAIAAVLPKRVIAGEAGPYLERYTLRTFPDGAQIYLHHFLRGDEDEALHSHPWAGESLVLAGGYREERRVEGDGIEVRTLGPGDRSIIAPDTFHRVDLLDGETCWTLFSAGPRVQSWGFWDRRTKVFTPWTEYLAKRGLFSMGGP
jgi:hypothetical protein